MEIGAGDRKRAAEEVRVACAPCLSLSLCLD